VSGFFHNPFCNPLKTLKHKKENSVNHINEHQYLTKGFARGTVSSASFQYRILPPLRLFLRTAIERWITRGSNICLKTSHVQKLQCCVHIEIFLWQLQVTVTPLLYTALPFSIYRVSSSTTSNSKVHTMTMQLTQMTPGILSLVIYIVTIYMYDKQTNAHLIDSLIYCSLFITPTCFKASASSSGSSYSVPAKLHKL
jgi:hypothetical protein